MDEQIIYEDLSFWQAQGLASFCKAKSDWFKFDKVHLSFVSHAGKPNCKQIMSIEGALKIHGKDGALFLSDMILTGAIKKMAESSRAQTTEGGYPKIIFESMGGTSTARSKNGKCMFRSFSVAPGIKGDFVFQMTTCDGTESETGGIQAVAGAKRETIRVALSSGDLFDFARSVQIEYSAYRNSVMNNNIGDKLGPIQPVQGMDKQTALPIQQAPVAQNSGALGRVCVIVDTSGTFNFGIPVVTTSKKVVAIIQDATKAVLQNEKRFVAEAESYRNAVSFCEKNEKGSVSVIYSGKIDTQSKCALVISIVDIQ